MRHQLAVLGFAIAASVNAPAVWADAGLHVMVTPGELKWTDMRALPPGAKIAIIQGPLTEPAPFMYRLRFPANYEIPAHWHPSAEHLTVISGTFHMGVGDKLDRSKSVRLPAGSVAIVPARIHHFGWTQEETIVQLHGLGPSGLTYVNAADDPRRKR